MHRRSIALVVLVFALALPLSASQFLQLPFDRLARESTLIVRGTLGNTWSAWDDAHQVIYTYATVRVQRYFGESTGPDTLLVREVGGTVGDYTQEAIGFPTLRDGQDVVLFLGKWEDGVAYRIHAYNQGKLLVSMRGGVERLVEDPERQGEARESHGAAPALRVESEGLTIDELAEMVDAARAGRPVAERQQQ
ncbi:MAG TPA: hypothetical protein VFN10_12650 [Thermoanaerobaculia bacterium]|nr:hypothetical protein [Thermoanaerobaculia bacterium]